MNNELLLGKFTPETLNTIAHAVYEAGMNCDSDRETMIGHEAALNAMVTLAAQLGYMEEAAQDIVSLRDELSDAIDCAHDYDDDFIGDQSIDSDPYDIDQDGPGF